MQEAFIEEFQLDIFRPAKNPNATIQQGTNQYEV